MERDWSITFDRIGACSIKIKKLFIMRQPWWVSGAWKIISIFLSSKMRKRMKLYGGNWKKLFDRLGSPAALPAFIGHGATGPNLDRLFGKCIFGIDAVAIGAVSSGRGQLSPMHGGPKRQPTDYVDFKK